MLGSIASGTHCIKHLLLNKKLNKKQNGRYLKNSDFMKVFLNVVRSQFCWVQCTQIKKLLDTFTATGSCIPYSPKLTL